MPRVHKLLTATLAAGAIAALPATAADAAMPKKGVFYNKSTSNGLRIKTTRHTIRNVEFYCARTSWVLVGFVDLHRDGSFRYSGQMRQYGYERQPWGKHHVSFSGRFTSSHRVRVSRKLPGRCHRATVSAKRKSG